MKKKPALIIVFLTMFIITLSFVSCDVVLDILFDHEPPTATMTTPNSDLEVTIDTGSIQIIVHAEDDGRVNVVKIYVDDTQVGSVYNFDSEEDTVKLDFIYNLDVTEFADCIPHTVYAIAHDNGLNSVTTLPITLIVNQEYYAETYPDVTQITPTTAMMGGMVSCDNNSPITERGMCWSQSPDPTVDDPHTSSGYGLGIFSCELTNLVPDSYYYSRAYAINDLNTFYGENVAFITPPVDIPEYEMVKVKSGFFNMGDVFDSSYAAGLPIHRVYLNKFQIGKYEVTQDLFVWVMGKIPCRTMGGRLPVYGITWVEAVKFCNAFSEAMGLNPVYTISSISVTCDFTKNGYRLPTEAEWEYAARSAGRNDRKYSGTNNVDSVGYFAWYHEDSIKPVGTKLPNDLGIYDMNGNVMEWCWGEREDYTEGLKLNPRTKKYYTNNRFVTRGESVRGYYKSNCGNAFRGNDYSGTSSSLGYFYLGLRLVRKE